MNKVSLAMKGTGLIQTKAKWLANEQDTNEFRGRMTLPKWGSQW